MSKIENTERLLQTTREKRVQSIIVSFPKNLRKKCDDTFLAFGVAKPGPKISSIGMELFGTFRGFCGHRKKSKNASSDIHSDDLTVQIV